MLQPNSSAQLQDMGADIASLQAHEASKTQTSALTRAYTGAGDVRNLAQNPNVQQVYTVIKNNVSNFVPYSRKLVAVLNEVAKVHVFISAVVVPFAAAIELENTRRENDGRVTALTESMCDMMFTFSQLNRIPKDHVAGDKLSLDERLKDRMDEIARKIKECSKTCDTFYRKKGYIKFINSYSWRDKFTTFAEDFTTLKAQIHSDLQLHISVGVANVQETLGLMRNDMKQLMEIVFSKLVPLSERTLATHIQRRYGGREAVIGNDAAMQELAMASLDEFDSDDSKALGSNKPSALAIRMELEQDVDQAIANNIDFDKKFGVMKLQILEVKETVIHQSDRVIEEIKKELHNGPHERILDKDMYKIWKEMGWKRSIKARHLVMGLHAYFGDEGEHTDEEGDKAFDAIKDTTVANRLLNLGSNGEDKWALQYIDILYLQPLLEAFDDDISGFVTITEVNEFTASRPRDWSIRRWIAYWAIGFEMQSHWYFRRIRSLLSIIQATSVKIQPENRKTVSLFFRCRPMRFVEDLLAGLRHTDKFEGIDWEEDVVFSKFRGYISDNETNIKSKLRKLEYNIGDKTALQAVTGQGRLEKHLLAVIYLLLERAAQIVNHGRKFTLNFRELKTIRRSLATVGQTFCQRVDRFSAAVRLQNLNHTEQVAKVFYGMFSYVRERDPAKMNEYWKLPLSSDKLFTEKEPHLSDKDTLESYHPSPQGPTTLVPRLKPLLVATSTESGRALLGEWRRPRASDKWSTSFNITEVSEGSDHEVKIAGFGSDSYGSFAILGKANLSTRGLVFRTRYYVENMVWQYEGTFDDECSEIKGTCRPQWTASVDIPDPSSPSIPSAPIFTSSPSEPSEYGTHFHLIHPSQYRALWKIACNFAMKQVTSGFSWTHFAWSRDSKRAFIQLTQSRESNGFLDLEQRKKLHHLDKTAHPDDLAIWKYTYEFMACRESKHLNSRCDKCDVSPLRTTWITCLQCSRNEVDNTVNLCPSCVISSFVRLNESGEKVHTFQHNVVQFRTPLFRTYLQDMLDKAERITKRITEKALDPASSACVQCSAELVPPFWACLECKSENALICRECNQRTEARRPWLLEHRLGDAASNNEDGSKMHDWWHTLVLFTQVDAVSANSRLSLEDRFALLQRAFDIQSQQLEMERTTSRERHEILVSRIQRLESLRGGWSDKQ